MSSVSQPVYSVPVREMVEFALRQGDLGGERIFVGPARALAGTRGHQRLQGSRPAGYQKEVPVAFAIETPELTLRIQGRVDGVLASSDEVVLEEIKTVQNRWSGVADPLHWAQAKCYGFIYCHLHTLERITIQLSYLNLETGELTEFREGFSRAALVAFFDEVTAIYLEWVVARHDWRKARDESVRLLDLPF